VRRIAVFMISTAIVLLAGALPAWAHVTLSPSEAPKGSDAVLTFNVPNEMDNATTTKLVVNFPIDHPIADVLVEPVAGWTSSVQTTHVATPIHTDSGDVTDAVKNVTWTATNGGVPKGGFQQFSVSVGLPSDGESLEFDAFQTYSNGQTVAWNQQTPENGPEPDNPAPVLKLTAGEDSGTTPATNGSTRGTATATSNVKKSDVDSAKTIGIIALIIAIVGLLAAIAGFVVGRRRTT
jgi:uncharacterized protein YcnI